MLTQAMEKTNKMARLAGLLYVTLIPLGIFGMIYVPANLIVADDMLTTLNRIIENEMVFRLSIVSALLCQLVSVPLVYLLYKLLKPVNKNYAFLMMIYILIGAPIAMLNELNLLAVLLVINESDYLAAFNTDQIHSLVSMLLQLHELGIQIASIFWGLWLFPMGYLVFKSGFLPKVIGLLLIVAGCGYFADAFISFIFPEFNIKFSEFLFLGEVLISFWLLIKGVDLEQWQKVSIENLKRN
ncbi:MAG: DUF4386 domain-containing protein [Gammaproteobacteria bacterium]|nr:DUF4386 domain-containing protein [Gammaproteobacteria bacterium]